MTILGLLFAALFVALAIWITLRVDWPQPIKWFIAGLAVVICLVVALKLTGIDLGHL